MYPLNIYKFWELSKEAQDRAASRMATKLWEDLKTYGFGNLARRKNAIGKMIGFVKEIATAQFLEDGTPVNLPIHGPKPVTRISEVLAD